MVDVAVVVVGLQTWREAAEIRFAYEGSSQWLNKKVLKRRNHPKDLRVPPQEKTRRGTALIFFSEQILGRQSKRLFSLEAIVVVFVVVGSDKSRVKVTTKVAVMMTRSAMGRHGI